MYGTQYWTTTTIPISVSSASSNVLIAATTGKRILVTGFGLVTGGAVSVTFEDEDGTDLTGAMPFAANGGIVVNNNPSEGQFVCTLSKGLNILLGSAVQVSGWLTYRLV